MKKNKAGIICIAIGAALILAALLLLLHNMAEDDLAGKTAINKLSELQDEISERENQLEPTIHVNPYDEDEVAESKEMTVAEIDGYGYIGYLSIPVLKLKLPVMSEWSYPQLKIAPCRQFGSTKSDDLVIAGHNYRTHFGHLSSLRVDDLVQFTDMDGTVSYYVVGEVNTIPPDSTDEVEHSQWALVLYTCTPGGKNRVMVGCQRITEDELEQLADMK